MPGRFSNLELGGSKPAGRQETAPLVESAPDDQHYLARALEDNHWGRFESALRLYTRALHENRALIVAWVGQVQMLVQLNEIHEARVWSDKALELFRGNGELLAAKAEACARLGDQAAAMTCSDGSLQAQGSSPWRWQARGEVLLAGGQGHYEDCFEKALAEPGADWFDRVQIGRIYLHHQRCTNAMNYFGKALELQPVHGRIWFEIGCCQKELGLLAAARTSFERCLELRADHRPAREALRDLDGSSASRWLGAAFRRLFRR